MKIQVEILERDAAGTITLVRCPSCLEPAPVIEGELVACAPCDHFRAAMNSFLERAMKALDGAAGIPPVESDD
jgi:hypothetical protein